MPVGYCTLQLGLTGFPLIQPQFLNLAREGVAPHAQQRRGFDAPAASVLQHPSDECAIKLC